MAASRRSASKNCAAASLNKWRASGPQNIETGWRVLSMSLTVVRRLCGQPVGGPKGVAVQSNARSSVPEEPPPAKKFSPFTNPAPAKNPPDCELSAWSTPLALLYLRLYASSRGAVPPQTNAACPTSQVWLGLVARDPVQTWLVRAFGATASARLNVQQPELGHLVE